jgi:hypothetical protein
MIKRKINKYIYIYEDDDPSPFYTLENSIHIKLMAICRYSKLDIIIELLCCFS